MTSCGTLKKKQIKTSDTKTTEVVQTTSDSSNVVKEETKVVTEVSQPIEKENYISLMTADSLTNIKINEALRNFRYYDRSGGNSVKASYDPKSMQLLIQAFIAQTENKASEKNLDTKINTNKESSSEKTFEQNVDEYLEKIKIPWWIYAGLAFLFKNQIISTIGFFIPGIHRVKTARDLFNSKNIPGV